MEIISTNARSLILAGYWSPSVAEQRLHRYVDGVPVISENKPGAIRRHAAFVGQKYRYDCCVLLRAKIERIQRPFPASTLVGGCQPRRFPRATLSMSFFSRKQPSKQLHLSGWCFSTTGAAPGDVQNLLY